MPCYDHLLRWLRLAPQRVNTAGEIELTALEALTLRNCEFGTAKEGWWKVPPLPDWLVRSYNLPASLAAPPSPAPPVRIPDGVPPVRTDGLAWPQSYRADAVNDAERLHRWVQRLPADQQRILRSLVRQPDYRLRTRQLQQHVHRLGTARFHDGLNHLLRVGLVRLDGLWVELAAEIQPYAREVVEGVFRALRARAMAVQKTRHPRTRKRRYYEDPTGSMHWQPAFKDGAPMLPPVGTSAWGRSMLAKKGGYARQAQCRARGEHPTAAATAARVAKRNTVAAPRTPSTVPGQDLSGGPLKASPPSSLVVTRRGASSLREAARAWVQESKARQQARSRLR